MNISDYMPNKLIIDHITMNMLNVIYRLSIIERVVVIPIYERVWDFDEMREVNDIVAYEVVCVE